MKENHRARARGYQIRRVKSTFCFNSPKTSKFSLTGPIEVGLGQLKVSGPSEFFVGNFNWPNVIFFVPYTMYTITSVIQYYVASIYLKLLLMLRSYISDQILLLQVENLYLSFFEHTQAHYFEFQLLYYFF